MSRLQILVFLFAFVNNCFPIEQSCSPYHFQEKLLEKMINMEYDFKEMQKAVNAAQISMDASVKSAENQIEQLEDKTDKFMETLRAEMKAFDNIYNGSRPESELCPDGWIYFEKSCYSFGKDTVQFYDAQRYCRQFNADLVNIETSTENYFLRNYLKELKAPRHWIGLTDIEQEGDWRFYPSLEKVTFFEWGKYQPNNGRVSNCAAIWESFQYLWVDEPCTNRFRPLCEKVISKG